MKPSIKIARRQSTPFELSKINMYIHTFIYETMLFLLFFSSPERMQEFSLTCYLIWKRREKGKCWQRIQAGHIDFYQRALDTADANRCGNYSRTIKCANEFESAVSAKLRAWLIATYEVDGVETVLLDYINLLLKTKPAKPKEKETDTRS